ncbi:MAG: hypothetical protein JXB39_06505 [Deltaproteobacteria bacterium]|nr:hypothetical protein [Deltaproteobacteria bacterium]
MFGYLTAVLLLAAGGYVLWYNAHHIDSVVLLPFLTTFVPSLEGDLPAQGRVSAIVLFALGGLALLWRLGRDIRAARRRDTP